MRKTMLAGAIGGVAATMALTGALAAAPAAPAGDPVAGKAVFVRCSICHAVAAGQNRLGPSLAGIVGGKAAMVPNYAFSPAMKASGIVWTPANLDAFLAKPSAKVPGTKMAFVGLANPVDRANVIAYLATVK